MSKIDRKEGLRQIDEAKWTREEEGPAKWLSLKVKDENDEDVEAYLTLRPPYCDRGHIQLLIDGRLYLDGADSFPRFFFSMEEADSHVRTFLKWRLWKERTNPHTLEFTRNDEDRRTDP